MAIKELDPGDRHVFAITALRVRLTGNHGGATLRAVDQAGHESVTVRLTPAEIIVTPEPRRLRLVATPVGGGSFSPWASVGLTLLTEGSGAAGDQILVATTDVGALASFELATLEFATDRAVLTVGRASSVAPPDQFSSSTATTVAPSSAPRTTRLPRNEPDEAEYSWIRGGRYAFRRAVPDAASPPVGPNGWALVLDGSASMLRPGDDSVREVLEAVAGILVQWVGRWPESVVCGGVGDRDLSTYASDPGALLDAALGEGEPGSGVRLASAVRAARQRLPEDGGVLVLTDGVPSDVAELATLAREAPALRLFVVALARSAYAVTPDSGSTTAQWWCDELAGMSELGALANVTVAAVPPDEEDRVRVDDACAEALARSLVGEPR